jgi:outer membrane murein-binding lipoprotein Lpp
MTPARRDLQSLAAAVIALVLIAGCGGDEPAVQSTPVELEDQLGFSESGVAERQSRVEGRIRDCMKAQGFDYVPLDPLAQRAALTGNARMTDEEFLEQFGYGISTLFGRGTQESDPNARLRRSLGPADRAAYDRSLWGDNPGLTFAEAIDNDAATELGGCTKRATEAVFGGAAVLSTLQGKFDELEERINQDQRMVRAVEKWSACMAERGYRYDEPEEIDTDLIKRFKAILGPGTQAGATAPADPGATYDRAALAALKREEVKVARADLACEKREITPVELEVRPQYEQAFRDRNRQLISQVRPVGG